MRLLTGAEMPTLREIDVTVLSARDLQKEQWFGIQSPCALLHIPGTNQRHATAPFEKGGTEATWNQRFTFRVEEILLRNPRSPPQLVIVIYGSSKLSGSPLGTAIIPLQDVLAKAEQEQYGAYPVIRPSGQAQGLVNVSVRAGPPGDLPQDPPPHAGATTGYPSGQGPNPTTGAASAAGGAPYYQTQAPPMAPVVVNQQQPPVVVVNRRLPPVVVVGRRPPPVVVVGRRRRSGRC